MTKEDLIKIMTKEIENRKFNVLEITGFKADPKLALLAGASIGYQLGLDFYEQLLNSYDNNK